jgi:hypothetical protein
VPPATIEPRVLAAFAHFDGTAAASAFLPSLAFYGPAGVLLGRVFPQQVAAGGTADVTFAPFLRSAFASGGVFPPGTTLDYVEAPAGTLNITATSAATADSWIVGNPITLDGATRIQIEVWIALATTDHDVVAELYMDGTDVSRLCQTGATPAGTVFVSMSLYGTAHLTPAAGTHTFEVRAWKDAGSTSSFLSPTPFPFDIFAPSFYRVTAD